MKLDFTPIPYDITILRGPSWQFDFRLPVEVTNINLNDFTIKAYIWLNNSIIETLSAPTNIVIATNGKSFFVKKEWVNGDGTIIDDLISGTVQLQILVTDANGRDYIPAYFNIHIAEKPTESAERASFDTHYVINVVDGAFYILGVDSLYNLTVEKAGEAEQSAIAANSSKNNAKTSEDNAKTSENNAKTSENNAKTSETNAKTSETNAKTSETNSKTSETNSKTSETNSKTSENNAKSSENIATQAASLVANVKQLPYVGRLKNGIDISTLTFEKGRFANGNGFNVEVVDWCIRTTNYFASTAGTYYVRAKAGFRFVVVESTTGNISTAADASLTASAYVASQAITITKPFIRLQIAKWNDTTNALDTSYIFDITSKDYLNFVQILKEKDRLSETEDNLTQEISDRKSADTAINILTTALQAEDVNIKNAVGLKYSGLVTSWTFNSQNASVNNQRTLSSALTTGVKYYIYVRSASALGQSKLKILLYFANNSQSQVVVDTNSNDLSKGYLVPFTAQGPIDYVNIQLYTVTATGISVEAGISTQDESSLKSFKETKTLPFYAATSDTYNTSIRNLLKDVKLIGAGWSYADRWCFRIFRKNTSTNFLLGLYKSFGDGYSCIDDGTNVSIAFSDIDGNLTTGIQKITKQIDSTRSIYIEIDMAVYATLSVFQLDLTFAQTGIAKEAYVSTISPYFSSPALLKTDKPIITLIDDDGALSFKNWLKASLDSFGYKAGIGVVTDWVGTANFMTLQDLKDMKTAGHEIMSHTKSHAGAIWYPSAWTTTGYDQDAIESECKLSRKWFLDNGFGLVENLIYAGGGYDGLVNKPYRILTIQAVRKYYENALSTVAGINSAKILDNYMLNRVQINMSVNNLAYYTNLIDSCKANAGWLILFTHSDSSNEVNQTFYESILSYIQASGISVMKFSDALAIKRNIASVGVLEQENSLYIGRDGSIQ